MRRHRLMRATPPAGNELTVQPRSPYRKGGICRMKTSAL